MAEGPVQTNDMRRVHVRVPATTANLGPGFDCMGMALDIYDVVALSLDKAVHPPAAEKGLNRGYAELVQMSAQRLFKEAGRPAPALSIACQHGFP
ncbi:MAG TPA: homoserine kinase, partial [Dehalococcoidia bacterium]|nr:homoserine kinase [Dehalococcoidia bacterium]